MTNQLNSSIQALAENNLVGQQIHDATQNKLDNIIMQIDKLEPGEIESFNKLKQELKKISQNYFTTMQELVVNNHHQLKTYARK